MTQPAQQPHPVSEVAGPNDHPPAGVRSLWRLRGYLRPYALALTIMATAALLGVALTIAIPLVTKGRGSGHLGSSRREGRPIVQIGAEGRDGRNRPDARG